MSYILGQKKIAQMIGVRSDTPIISPTRFYESVEERDNDTDNRIIGDLAVIEDKGPIPAPDIFANVTELTGLISKGLKTVVNRDFIPQYENYVYDGSMYSICVAYWGDVRYSGWTKGYVQTIVVPLDENGTSFMGGSMDENDHIFGGAIISLSVFNDEAGDPNGKIYITHISPSLLNLESFTHILIDPTTSIAIDKTQYDENGYLLDEYISNITEDLYVYVESPNDAFLEFSKIYQQRFNATVELKVGDKFNELRFDKMLYHLYASPFTDNNPMLPLFRLSEGDILNHELLLFRCDSTTGIPNINGDCFITVMVKIEGIGEKTVQKLTVIGSSLDIPTGFTFGGVTSDPVVKEWNNLTINFDSEATVEEIMYVPTEGNPDWTKHLILAPPIEGTKGVKSILNPERKYIDFKEGEGGSTTPIVQTTGDSITDVMSQKAVTDELNKVAKPVLEIYMDGGHRLNDRAPFAQDEIFECFGGQAKFESMISWFKNTRYFGDASISIKVDNLTTYSGIIANQILYMPLIDGDTSPELLILVYPNPVLYNVTETIGLQRAKEGQWTGTCSRNLGIVNKVMVGMEYYTYPSIELANSLYHPLLDYTGNIEIELNMLWPSTTKVGGEQKRVYSRTFTGTTPEFNSENLTFFKPNGGIKIDSLYLVKGQIGTIPAGDAVPTNAWSISPSVDGFWVVVGDQTDVVNLTNKLYCITVMYTKD